MPARGIWFEDLLDLVVVNFLNDLLTSGRVSYVVLHISGKMIGSTAVVGVLPKN